MEVEKEDKQRYLTEHILNNNYDGDEFLDYCCEFVGNADVDSWSFRDLENIVKSFIASRNITQKPQETSYIAYEQGDEPEKQKSSSSLKAKTRPPSPVKEVYFEPVKPKKNAFQAQVFDNPPSPVRNTAHNIVKLAPEQKISLDEVFKDPFSKNIKPIKPTNDLYDNIWSEASGMVTPANKFKNQFDSILTTKQPGSNTSQQNSKLKVQPVIPTFDIERHIQKEKEKQVLQEKPQKQLKSQREEKVVGNKDIFDLDFGIPIEQTRQKSPRASKTHHQEVVSPTVLKPQIPRSPRSSARAAKQDTRKMKSSSPTSTPSNLKASITPSMSDSRKRSKQGSKVVQEDWFDVVNCIRAKRRQITGKPNLQIKITGHEIVNRNVFMPDYVRYFVSTPAINSEVKRKYNHFVKLRGYLEKFYPGFRLPYLSKSNWFQQTDPNNIAAQKFMITQFMNDLLMSREIRNCRIVEEFLTLKDYKGLKVKFQEYDKMGVVHSIEELCLLKGEINVGYSQNHRVYIDKIPSFTHSMEGVFEKYKKLLEQLTSNHNALQRTLNQLAETTHAMHDTVKNFNSSVGIGECNQLEGTLKLIHKMYKELDKQSKFQMELVESELKPLFKYQKDNIGTIKEIISIKSKLQQSFNPNIKTEKKEIYTNLGLDSYKVSLSESSKNPIVLKYQHGYFSNQIVTEFKNCLSNLSQKLSNKFGQFCRDHHQRSIQYSSFWGNMNIAITLPVT